MDSKMKFSFVAEYLNISGLFVRNNLTLVGKSKIVLKCRLHIPVLIGKVPFQEQVSGNGISLPLIGEQVIPSGWQSFQNAFLPDRRRLIVKRNEGGAPVHQGIVRREGEEKSLLFQALLCRLLPKVLDFCSGSKLSGKLLHPCPDQFFLPLKNPGNPLSFSFFSGIRKKQSPPANRQSQCPRTKKQKGICR